MKVILFGLGNYYGRFRKYFNDNDIVVLCDNNKERQGEIVDGKLVIAPEKIEQYEYDKIYILSSYIKEIRRQLISLGVIEKKIVSYYDVKISVNQYKKYEGDLSKKDYSSDILIIASDMNNSGATVALLEVVRQINVLGEKNIVVATPLDGELTEKFVNTCSEFIIDPRLLSGTLNDIEWTSKYSVIFVNTVHMFYLFRDRKLSTKIIWWLHEPSMFYSNVDSEILKSLDYSNLDIYAVSKVAINAFMETGCLEKCRTLVCGKTDIPRNNPVKKRDAQIAFITVGGVMNIKGQDVLVSAVRKLCEYGYDNFSVKLIGYESGSFAENLKRMCLDYNLPVVFCGAMRNEEVLTNIENSDVLICSSREETLSIAAIEAMMKRIPCIVSSTAGISEYIQDFDNSIIFESTNSDDLCEKMKWCLDNHSILPTMGNLARELYEQVFSTKHLLAQLDIILRN